MRRHDTLCGANPVATVTLTAPLAHTRHARDNTHPNRLYTDRGPGPDPWPVLPTQIRAPACLAGVDTPGYA
jgi:hypothetical protein